MNKLEMDKARQDELTKIVDMFANIYRTPENDIRKERMCIQLISEIKRLRAKVCEDLYEAEELLRKTQGRMLVEEWLDAKGEELLQQSESEAQKDPE